MSSRKRTKRDSPPDERRKVPKTSKQEWGIKEGGDNSKDAKHVEKQKPNYKASGKLEKAKQITKNGVVLKHHEPSNAAVPKKHWRIYVFKDKDLIQTLHIHRQSCFLIGRERRVADIKTDHLTCSKQHAVIQFKLKTKLDKEGNSFAECRPYIMDLKSGNGTRLNKKRIDSQRYYELLERDCLNFGSSSRDYVLICAGDD
jgi:smad nuclear-interacting protein 1